MNRVGSDLSESSEEAVDVVSRWAGVQRVLVFLNIFDYEHFELFKSGENFVLATREPLHQPREDVVQLRWEWNPVNDVFYNQPPSFSEKDKLKINNQYGNGSFW